MIIFKNLFNVINQVITIKSKPNCTKSDGIELKKIELLLCTLQIAENFSLFILL